MNFNKSENKHKLSKKIYLAADNSAVLKRKSTAQSAVEKKDMFYPITILQNKPITKKVISIVLVALFAAIIVATLFSSAGGSTTFLFISISFTVSYGLRYMYESYVRHQEWLENPDNKGKKWYQNKAYVARMLSMVVFIMIAIALPCIPASLIDSIDGSQLTFSLFKNLLYYARDNSEAIAALIAAPKVIDFILDTLRDLQNELFTKQDGEKDGAAIDLRTTTIGSDTRCHLGSGTRFRHKTKDISDELPWHKKIWDVLFPLTQKQIRNELEKIKQNKKTRKISSKEENNDSDMNVDVSPQSWLNNTNKILDPCKKDGKSDAIFEELKNKKITKISNATDSISSDNQ